MALQQRELPSPRQVDIYKRFELLDIDFSFEESHGIREAAQNKLLPTCKIRR